MTSKTTITARTDATIAGDPPTGTPITTTVQPTGPAKAIDVSAGADATTEEAEVAVSDAGERTNEASSDCSFATAPTRSERVGDAAGDFATIRVSYGPQNMLVGAMNEARLSALSIRARRASTGMRIPMPVMRTIAEIGVGKTWAAEKLIARCTPTDPDDHRCPVLHVELDTSGKQASLPKGILRKLKVRGWNHGNDPEILWARAIDAMRKAGVEILIFDEMDRAARRPSIGPVIGGDIMDLLVNGDVAVAFLGTKDANKVFDRCPPLKDRMKAPAVMKALDWMIDDEKKTFTDFLGKMDQALVSIKLIDEPADLADETIAKPLWDVCRGRLRPLCLLLEEAVTAIHREDDAGARLLTLDVLAQAVEDLSIPGGTIDYNPFTEEKPA